MIFLFDGTGNDATEDSFSNVYALNQLIAETGRSKRPQIAFYLPGIGTKFTVRRAVNRKFGIPMRLDKVRQQVFGDNIEQIILRAYVNLCANFREGDDIVIVGFSRGAVGARIFSRLISDFGVLTAKNLLLLDSLWNEFVEISNIADDPEYHRQRQRLKDELKGSAGADAFHRSTEWPIRFLGCFDTVMGPGDEIVTQNVRLRDCFPASGVQHVVHLLSMHDARADFELRRFVAPLTSGREGQSLKEIWMPGVHSDVGGGYPENFISNIALLTMAKLIERRASILLDKASLAEIVSAIRAKVKAGKIFVNCEPFVRIRGSRIKQIVHTDEVHPLHKFMIGKNVYWKSLNLTPYEDRIGSIGVVDASLQALFDDWVRVRRQSAKRISRSSLAA
jgi:uncharacterized protein (DUF2235 family)